MSDSFTILDEYQIGDPIVYFQIEHDDTTEGHDQDRLRKREKQQEGEEDEEIYVIFEKIAYRYPSVYEELEARLQQTGYKLETEQRELGKR